MRLAYFIRDNSEAIIGEWENFARTIVPSAKNMDSPTLRDHIHSILDFIISDITTPQTGQAQEKKSRGQEAKPPGFSAAETHAAIRLAGGFNLSQMVSEYRSLRASIVKLWCHATAAAASQEIMDLTRFNESIDQQLTESISHYMKKVEHSKDMFLGILSHDLRTPISAALISAELMPKIGTLNPRQAMLCSQIVDCASRANEIVTSLFDLTRARFGSGFPVVREAMDMGFLSRRLVQEMRVVYPNHTILLEVSGATEGQWDKSRIGQAFANLIGNAAQYGFAGLPITVKVVGTAQEMVISVHNEGVPIPVDKLDTLFDSLTRGTEESNDRVGTTHLGLGLYITREIAISHGGTIDVASSEKDGTTFTIHLPVQPDIPGDKTCRTRGSITLAVIH